MNNHAETTAVKKVIEAYMTGTYRADVPMLESVFHPRAVMNGYLGPDKILGTPALFIQDMASAPSMEANGDSYQAEIEQIRIDGNIATVIVSETGFRGSACLVDHFHLIKEDGSWHIISKLFTTV